MTTVVTPRLDSYADCLAFLYARNQFAIKLGLSNIGNLLAELGNPHLKGRYLHVAGTNGKGSVCANLAAMMGALGHGPVGLYTSPHLVSFRERIQVDGKCISPEWIVSFMRRAVEPMLRLNATYFECVTAMALVYFREAGCGTVVLETGLGGRLDATNVVKPELCVITPISLDHTEYLGGTVAEIFSEKLGISKPGAPLVHMETDPLLRRMALEKAEALGVAVYALDDFSREGSERFRGLYREYELPPGLRSGECQYDNVCVTLLASEVSEGKALPPEALWMPALKSSVPPGRMQLLEAEEMPTVLLDGAHNPEAVATLSDHLQKNHPNRRITLLFAIMGDKDYRSVLLRIRDWAERLVYVTLPGHARALPFEALREAALSLGMLEPESIELNRDAVMEILYASRKAHGEDALVVVCGSFYLLGEIIPILRRAYPGLEFFSQFTDEEA